MFLNALYGEINLAHCFFTSFQPFIMRLPEINFAGNICFLLLSTMYSGFRWLREFYIHFLGFCFRQ
jgi:hypothetical protein